MIWPIALLLCFAVHHNRGQSANDNSRTVCAGNGWTIWKGNCYKLFIMTEAMNFPNAENICREFGSHAASVHSDAENKFLASIAKEAYNLLEPLVREQIHGGLWIGYKRRPGANADKYECSFVDGTAMDYANAPLPDSARHQTKTQAHWLGYPWEGPNPKNIDGNATLCGNSQCPNPDDPEHCVEMLNWPGSVTGPGTWNDLNCVYHKLSGVFCKKPVNCVG